MPYLSSVAHTALPLVLSTVDSRLSSTRLQLAARHRQLHFYKEIMRILQSRYEATDKVCAFIESALSSSNAMFDLNPTQIGSKVNGDNSLGSGGDLAPVQSGQFVGRRIKNISQFFASQPRSYLRLSLLLDYALSRGQYPRLDNTERLWQRLRLFDSP